MYICVCKGISDRHIREAVHSEQADFRQLRCQTGAGTQCGRCRKAMKELVASLASESPCLAAGYEN